MRLKVILSFLAIQIVSFAIWQGVHALGKTDVTIQPVSGNYRSEVNHQAAKAPEQPFSNVKFTMRTENKDFYTLNSDKKHEIILVLEKFPEEQISTLQNIILDYDPDAHRGLGGKGIIIVRAVNIDPAEFYGVMIHEIGHDVDLGYLNETSTKKISAFNDGKKPVYESDPSLSFYRICWENNKNFKKDVGNQDFVSGYAMTDPFEDFAETYAYYVLHNKDFKSKTQNSEKLLAKFNYMKNTVFVGKEFNTGEYLTENLTRQPWDVTKLSYNLAAFLAS